MSKTLSGSLLILIFYFIEARFCTAATYVDYTTNTNLVPYSNLLPIEIQIDVKEENLKRFRIKPEVLNEIVEIEKSPDVWIKSFEKWKEMPYISKNIIIRFPQPPNNLKLRIKFIIQDTKTGKIYETPEKTYFSNKPYQTYISKVNTNINNWHINDKIGK